MLFCLRTIKISVLISFSIAILTVLIFSDSTVTTIQASSGGVSSARTGAPGETNCTGCHTQNAGAGQTVITAPANYTPGQTYQIQVQSSSTDSSRLSWGYMVTALTSANMSAGTFTTTDSNSRLRTVTVSGNARNYVEQSNSFSGQANSASWSFNWTAPATNVGQVTFYASGLLGDDGGNTSGDLTVMTTAISQPQVAVVIHHGFTDFDGDGKADASVFRASDGFWYLNRSTSGFTAVQWGTATDKMTPADFDGDDKADVAVWREGPANEATFYILQSSTNTLRTEIFGQTGDDPVAVGDWDGDGKADPAVYRDSASGSQSYFYYRGSLNNPSGNITYLPFGITGDKVVRGDFDGDGKLDAAVFRPSNSVWYILQSSNATVRYENWGIATDKFVPADYDGDGKTDVAVFRGGIWYVKQSSNSQAAYYPWGLDTDVLVPADFDGDGKTDPAVYRNGVWYVRNSSSGSLNVMNFGSATDKPVANSFVR